MLKTEDILCPPPHPSQFISFLPCIHANKEFVSEAFSRNKINLPSHSRRNFEPRIWQRKPSFDDQLQIYYFKIRSPKHFSAKKSIGKCQIILPRTLLKIPYSRQEESKPEFKVFQNYLSVLNLAIRLLFALFG